MMKTYGYLWKKWAKAEFSNFCQKNGAKKPCFGGYFLSKQEVTGSWSWWSFAAFKTTTDECHNTSISWKLPSKRWIFHWKKCPIFVDSVFNEIWPRPAERAFLASVGSLWWQVKKFKWPWRIKNGPDPKIFLLDFVKLLGPLQAT